MLTDRLPTDVVELRSLAGQVDEEVRGFRARLAAGEQFTHRDADQLRSLLDARDEITAACRELEHQALRRGEGGCGSKRVVAAAHEAGHAVALVWFDGHVYTAEVFVPENGEPLVGHDGWRWKGHCRAAPLSTVTDTCRGVVTAAGPAAEAVALFGQSPTPAQCDRVLAGQRDHRELTQFALSASTTVSDMLAAALPIVRRCWPAIARLAIEMDAGKVISHADVCAALGLSKDRQMHGFELANLRAGLRAVPEPTCHRV